MFGCFNNRGFTIVELVVAIFLLGIASLAAAQVATKTAGAMRTGLWDTQKIALIQTLNEQLLNRACEGESATGDTATASWVASWKVSRDRNLGAATVVLRATTADLGPGITRLEQVRWCNP